MSQPVRIESFGPTIPLPTPEPEATGSVSTLLKSPKDFAQLVAQDRMDLRSSMILAATALGFFALYGLAMGAFAGGNSLWQAMLKTPMILLGSVFLCAPGLYVLHCLTGAALSIRQTAALLSGLACSTSLIMVAFAPVVWLFGISTTNLQFMVILHGVVCGVALGCGLRLTALAMPAGDGAPRTLAAWAGVFLVVSAQMLTYFRPILSVSPNGAFREGKRQFFFEHFYASMLGRGSETAASGPALTSPAPSPAPSAAPTPAPSPKAMSN